MKINNEKYKDFDYSEWEINKALRVMIKNNRGVYNLRRFDAPDGLRYLIGHVSIKNVKRSSKRIFTLREWNLEGKIVNVICANDGYDLMLEDRCTTKLALNQTLT